MRYRNAIVRQVPDSFADGLTQANLGKPDLHLARLQWESYVFILRKLGLNVHVLPPLEQFPDSVFVEDTAVIARDSAALANPGAPSRRGEVDSMRDVPRLGFPICVLGDPGTLDGGDVLRLGRMFLIGLSDRTNGFGAAQLGVFLRDQNLYYRMIDLKQFPNLLHLKTGISYLEKKRVLIQSCLEAHPALEKYEQIIVPDDEAYAANALMINGTVLLAAGHPKTASMLRDRGFKKIVELEMSEFQKMDGGLSCLSLRY